MKRLFTRKRVVGAAAVLAAVGVSLVALAYWAGAGGGSASASVASLGAPTGVTASNTLGTGAVAVSWTGVTVPTGGSVDGYYVLRYLGATPGAACGTSSSSLTTLTSCNDTSVADGTYTYKVVAVWRTWTATSSASNSVTVVNDTTPPTVSSINRADASPTNGSTLHWTVTFSESVTGVGTSDFALAGSGAFGASLAGVSGSGTTYTVTASTGADGTLGLNLVDDDSITDTAGNKLGGTGTGNGNFTGQTYVVDRTAPTVSSINRAGTSPTNAGPLTWTVTFSEPVSGVATSNFGLVTSGISGTVPSITSATASVGSPSATWTVSISTTGATGTNAGSIGLDLTSVGSIQDAVTNGLSASLPVVGQAYTYDTTAPTVSSIVRAGASQYVNAGPLSFTVTFSEPVSNVVAARFSPVTSGLGGTAPSISSVTASGGAPSATWTVSVSTTGATGTDSGSIGLNLTSLATIQDVATNGLSASLPVVGPAYAYDTTAPTVSSIVRAGASQYVNAGPLSFTVTFSEPVSSVASSSFGLVTSGLGGTAPSISSVTASAGAPSATWTVSVSTTGATGTDSGSIGLNLTSTSGIADRATNGISASLPVVGAAYTYDTTAPTVSSINRAGTSPTRAGPLTWTVTFSEPVSGATTSSFGLATSGLGGTAPTIGSVTASGGAPSATWTVTASTTGTTGTDSGSIGLNLTSVSGIADRATNGLSASLPVVGQAYTYDTTAPTLVSLQMFDTNQNGKVDQVKATFSETLASYSAGTAPWTLANVPSSGSLSSVSVSGTVVTLTLTEGSGTADTAVGSFTVALAASAAGIRDAAGNQSTFSATAPADKAAPVPTNVVLTNITTLGRAASQDYVTVTYSEPLDATTFCSTWSNGSAQTISGNSVVDVLIANNASSDQLSVADVTSSNCGGAANFKFGSVNLAANYVGSNTTFTGTGSGQGSLIWTPGSNTLRITLGSGTGSVTGVAASTPVYTPDATLKDLAGNAIVTTAFSAPATSRF